MTLFEHEQDTKKRFCMICKDACNRIICLVLYLSTIYKER